MSTTNLEEYGKTHPKRALLRICTSDARQIVNKIEKLNDEDWYVISNLVDFSDVPDDFFDVILWSNCDLQAELRQVLKATPKLKIGGRMYFNNLLTDFDKLLRACTSEKAIQQLYGSPLSKEFLASPAFVNITSNLLAKIFESKDVKVKRIANLLVLERVPSEKYEFKPSTELAKQIKEIDQQVAEMFKPAPPKPTVEQVTMIKNRIFELVANKQATSVTGIITELEKQGLCYKEECKQYVTITKIKNIGTAIGKLKSFIDKKVIFDGITDPGAILESVKGSLDLNIADAKHWNAYLEPYINEQIAEQALQVAEEEEEEERYPEVAPPVRKLPPPLLPGLANVGSYSCFMDSLLFTIFLSEGNYFDRNILQHQFTLQELATICPGYVGNKQEYLENFQKELNKLANLIRGKEDPELTCYPILQQMKKCSELQQEFFTHAQMFGGADDSEFLINLLAMFDLYPTKVKVERAVSNDKKIWQETSTIVEKAQVLEVKLPSSPAAEPTDLVQGYQRILVIDWTATPQIEWQKYEGVPYPYSREKYTILESQVLIFHVVRRIIQTNPKTGKVTYRKNTNPVSFAQYIKNRNTNQIYELGIVTIHAGGASGGHYTAYFKYDGMWYFYNDIAPADKRVRPSNWDQIQNVGSQNGSLFIYYPT